MPSWLPSIPYRPAGVGYWSPQTSTINWCEEDYYLTTYSAEPINTVTNAMFMYLAYKGVRNCITQGHPGVFPVCFFGYWLVGVGSIFFHTTLYYPWQLVDELSMIYTTCIMFYATFTYGKTARFCYIMAVFLFSLAVFITTYYHYIKNPVFHESAYAVLTAAVLFRGMYIMEINIRPRWKMLAREAAALKAGKANGIASGKTAEQKEEIIRQDERDIKILKTMWTMLAYGLVTFLSGFGIWIMDNVFCSTLISWRRELGLPWGILLEGHGWWHLLTGIGAYYYIIWGVWLQHCLDKNQDDFDLYWPRFFTSFPVVMRRSLLKGKRGVVFADDKSKKLR